jgi:hypothetical protein
MGRPSYVCTVCSEHFTRKYSGKRHNQNLHNGAAEIVRLIDYLAGRSSGQYKPDNPFWYKRNNPYNNFGSATAADRIGNNFQQAPVSQFSTNPIYPPWHVTDDQSSLSRETILKIEELKRLVNKYPQYCTNPDGIIKLAIYNSIDGDNKLLDDKLEQLRTIDSLTRH